MRALESEANLASQPAFTSSDKLKCILRKANRTRCNTARTQVIVIRMLQYFTSTQNVHSAASATGLTIRAGSADKPVPVITEDGVPHEPWSSFSAGGE